MTSLMKKKNLLLLISLFWSSFLFCENVKVEVRPKSPVKNETFSVLFKIETTSDQEPYISFSPSRLEVQGRSREGVSVQATMINGKFRTKRELIYRYDMIATSSGLSYLRDIEVQLGGKVLKHPTVRISILDQAKALRSMFLMAEVSNTSPYLGEGIDVKYYLYSKYPILGQEFKTFPKLNGFIKRFHQVQANEETVEYQGEIYRRSLQYSARVFPEKTGRLYIDNLEVIVQFAAGTRGSPFGSFGGLGFQSMRKREVSNAKVEINVKPLPSENIPPSFSGLVGEHDFKVEVPKSKYLVNEAVELRLVVEGEGLLESYAAPQLYQNPYLEEFDTKSEVREVNRTLARKTFDYTYLARGPFNGEEKSVKVSYFNPRNETYQEKEITLPALSVVGGALQSSPPSSTVQPSSPDLSYSSQERVSTPQSIVAPLFSQTLQSQTIGKLSFVVYAICLVVFIQLCELFGRKYFGGTQRGGEAEKLYRKLKKKGFDFHLFHQFIFSKKDQGLKGYDAREVILSSTLSKREKDYLIKVLEYLENKVYSDKKNSKKVVFKDSIMKKWARM